jgi:hypothetical protein
MENDNDDDEEEYEEKSKEESDSDSSSSFDEKPTKKGKRKGAGKLIFCTVQCRYRVVKKTCRR